MKKKKCRFCSTFFWPHPKAGVRQKICKSPECKKALKAENNARWRKKNPECCQEDYERVKEWLKFHPGYLKTYRKNHPDYVQKTGKHKNFGIRKKGSVLIYKPRYPSNPLKSLSFSARYPVLIYKFRWKNPFFYPKMAPIS